MIEHLQKIIDIVHSSGQLSEEQVKEILDSVNAVDHQFTVTEFKLERTEKIKRTTAVFLDETIEELEQKRKAVEEQAKLIQAENERKTLELEEARQLQLSMLPEKLPQSGRFELAVYMKMATEVGGDYYDFSFNDDGSLNVAIGDATGHGLKAGIMVSLMKSVFTMNSPRLDIMDFFITANRTIKGMNLKRMMMGFSMLNINQNKVKLINAGLPPVFVFCKQTGSITEIKEHGMPIGAMNHSKYNMNERTLAKGDVILLMSDGLPELHNDQNEMYGYERIRSGFKKVAEKEPEEIINFLKDEGSAWVNDQDPDDDVTFVVIKVK